MTAFGRLLPFLPVADDRFTTRKESLRTSVSTYLGRIANQNDLDRRRGSVSQVGRHIPTVSELIDGARDGIVDLQCVVIQPAQRQHVAMRSIENRMLKISRSALLSEVTFLSNETGSATAHGLYVNREQSVIGRTATSDFTTINRTAAKGQRRESKR